MSNSASTFKTLVSQVRQGTLTSSDAADSLLDLLTEREMLSILDGDVPSSQMVKLPAMIKAGPITAGEIKRVGFPGFKFADGPRGVVIEGSTSFPVSMARAATWNRELETKVGLAMGLEARAGGASYSGAVCINLLRHPAWGRAQECYGEDPVLTGEMGVALTLGLRPNVMACVKHFALNSMENARFRVDVKVDDDSLHEVYLPHFKKVIKAGADSVMSAYNSVNGKFLDVNKVLLTDILRNEWGFKGFVSSDWVFGTHDAVESLKAGLDVEMPMRLLRARELPVAIKNGALDASLVRTSAKRVVATVIQHMATRSEVEPETSVVASQEHRQLARQVAIESMVLLKNDTVGKNPMLPLSSDVKKLAVIGKLAAAANLGDHGSSMVHPPATSSPLQGLREVMHGIEIIYEDGTDVEACIKAAGHADAVIIVAGMDHDDEGERVENDDIDMSILGFPFNFAPISWLLGKLAKMRSQFGRGGDRESLNLHAADEELIHSVAKANANVAVVLIGGSAIIVENWKSEVRAILHAWYPGMEGGRALADVLSGRSEPGGRLPVSIPTSESHLPYFDPEARSIVYDSIWGQRKLDLEGNEAAFPFGFGLGYTSFDLKLLSLSSEKASVLLKNTGNRRGSTVAQLYAFDRLAKKPVANLVGFARVHLGPDMQAMVEIDLDLNPIRERNHTTKKWSVKPGDWHIVATQHSPTTFNNSLKLKDAK